MTVDNSGLGRKIWSYCDTLRDDGVSYGDYLEQLTYLIFLKMADEQTKPPFNQKSSIPKGYDWQSLLTKDGDELEVWYRHILDTLGKEKGMLGIIFRKAQNKIQDPAKLNRLIKDYIDKESWFSLDVDIKGNIYEDLLQRNAEDIKSGAGQYFTPRNLIKAMVEVMDPKPGINVCDPACGTGGFILGVYNYIKNNNKLDKDQMKFLQSKTFRGYDIVDNVVRLCTMNLYLHGIIGDDSVIRQADVLLSDSGERFKMVLTNPPFGKKSSFTIVNEMGVEGKESIDYQRGDFWATTSNKQLNFLQHVRTILDINGKAAIVVPDNVLFEGGAGETIRKKLLDECDVHTLLRLPTGIFYAQGVKANVLFFDKKRAGDDPEAHWTEMLWVYDLRTNKHFTLKENPLTYEDLKDFIKCYNPKNRLNRKESDRFKSYTYDELIKRDKTNLDITWLEDNSLKETENLPAPEIIAKKIADNLEATLGSINELIVNLGNKQN